VNYSTLAYHCFRCGVGGKLKEVPEGLLADEADEILDEPRKDNLPNLGPPSDFLLLADEPALSALSAQSARDYMLSRGLGLDIWRTAHIGVCLSGWLEGRIIVPVMATGNPNFYGGNWQGWVGRSIPGEPAQVGKPKYLYPKGMPRGTALYNQQALSVVTSTPVIVVEGVFDALTLWPNAVAVLGKPTETHAWMLSKAHRPVVVVLDGDAHEEGEMFARKLRVMGQTTGWVNLPPEKDPDQVDKEWLLDQIADSIELPREIQRQR
jgi:DNA primase